MDQAHVTEGTETAMSRVATPPASLPVIRFSEWHVEPPQPPLLAERLQRVRWERIQIPVVAACAWVALSAFSIHMKSPPALVVTAVLIPAFIAWWREGPNAGPEVRELMEFPSPIPQFPVVVKLEAFGAEYGRDVGVVTFTDGFLHFHGRRCSFDLGRQSVYAVYQPSGKSGRRKSPGSQCVVRWSKGPGAGTIRFIPFHRLDKDEAGLRAKFMVAFEGWSNRKSWGKGPTILPPVTPEPTGLRTTRMVADWGEPLGGLILVAGLTFAGFASKGGGTAVAVLGGVLLCIGGWVSGSSGTHRKNLRALEKLEAGDHPEHSA